MSFSLPLHENIELSSDKNDDIKSTALHLVLNSLKTNWTNPSIKRLTDGLSNNLFAILPSSKESNNKKDRGVIVKIYGNNSDLIVDRKEEIRFMLHLAQFQMASRILLTFNNGFIYEYVSGNPVDIHDEQKPLLIARSMAEFHSIPLMKGDDNRTKAQLSEKLRHYVNLLSGKNDELHKRLDKNASSILSNLKNICWSDISKDIDKIEHIFEDKQSKWSHIPVVICHNDTQSLNFLYDEENNNAISLIDFEHCARNMWLIDVFNYFIEFAGLDSEEPDFDGKYLSRSKQQEWLQIYLSHATFLHNEKIKMSLDELCDLGDCLRAPIHLYWALWAFLEALLNPASLEKFDYIKYGKCRLEQYKNHKNEFFSTEVNQ
ncbi:unnamed protein product [Adineta steineri]|uniref:ethanolamine kinase n=1 Tax=Adineta steineri TaxID=433720 RepID=A0A819EEP8_9BILA|nr:unnamed protein product [Adineta steineri]CAF3849350.1 unnamed protein product [Adineta steineri]